MPQKIFDENKTIGIVAVLFLVKFIHIIFLSYGKRK